MRTNCLAAAVLFCFLSAASNSYADSPQTQPEVSHSATARAVQTGENAVTPAAKPRQGGEKNLAKAKAIRRAMAIRARIAKAKKLKQQPS